MKRQLFNLTVVATALSVSACGTMQAGDKQPTQSEIHNQDTQIEALTERENAIRDRENQLAQRESQLSQSAQTQQLSSQGLLPPGAKPGRCYGRVFVPPAYKTVSEQVLKRAESERIEVIPARYTDSSEKVLVQEAVTKLEVVPATYKYVEDRVIKVPESEKVIQVPAVYETVSEKVLVKPAHTVWKPGTGPIQKVDESTGEIMCLVEVPATYKTVTKRVLKTPASTKVVKIPAVYETVKRRVVDKPAHTREITIPAKYKSVQVTKLVEPAREKRIAVPAEYQTVNKTVMTKEGSMQWREILCSTNMTRSRISQVQQSLAAKGYNPGPIDGVIGYKTMRAVNEFQKAKGLPVDKYLDISTVEALGVAPR